MHGSQLVKRCRGVGFRKTGTMSKCILSCIPKQPQTLQLDCHGVPWNSFSTRFLFLLKAIGSTPSHTVAWRGSWSLEVGTGVPWSCGTVPCLLFQRPREAFRCFGSKHKAQAEAYRPLGPHSAGFPRNKRLFLLPVMLGWLLAVSDLLLPFFWADFDLQDIHKDCYLSLFRLPKSKSIGWWLASGRDLFLTVLWAGQSKLKVPARSCLVRAHFLGHRQPRSRCNLTWQKGRGISLGILGRH